MIKGSDFKKYWYTDIREIITLKDMLAGSAELYKNNAAFWVKKKRGGEYIPINYELLQHDVNALGTALMDLGLKGSRIAVMGQNCYEWIASYLSIINGTGIVVPIDKELTGPEIGNLLKASSTDTIFCTRQECKKLQGLKEIRRLIVMEFYGDRTDINEKPAQEDFDAEKYRTILAGDTGSDKNAEPESGVEILSWTDLLIKGEQLLEEGNTEFLDAEIDPDAMSVILFTSGTTGNPKGVMLSHRNITSNIMDVCRICQVYQTDKTLSMLPIHHTYECTLGMLLVLYRGASTAFCEGFKYISQNMKEAQSFAERALSFGNLLEWQKGAVHHLLAELAKARGDRKTAAEEYLLSSSFKEIGNGKLADYSNYLLSLSFFENSDEKLLQAAKEYGKLLGTVPQYKHDEKHHRHDKLRIGYISPDFRRHIVACFSRAFFRSADRACFEVYGYSLCDENDVSRIFAAEADGFRYIKGLSAKDAAALIYKDEIDILVDLSGHTGDNALPILAYKPAPVQISGIGWFRTTGLAAVDYFLADEASAPTGEEAQFTEMLIRLPHSHLCFTPILEAKSYPAPCRKAGHVTFGCFNQFDKVTDEMLSVWAEILRLVPGSKLFLKGSAFDRRERTDEIAKRLTEAGISMESVELEGYTDKYLDAYGRVDIAMDTYPYPGGGTTCDALYMGVPVVSLYGRHHHQRFGYSLLQN